MAFNTSAQLTRVVTLLESATLTAAGLQDVIVGVPGTIGYKLSAFVTLGGQSAQDQAAGLVYCDASIRVTFAYRTGGDVATAETALADVLDAFKTAFYAARKTDAVLRGMKLDLSIAGAPRYETVAGQEYREWPLLLWGRQEQTV